MLTTLCRSQLSDRNNAFRFFSPATASVDCNVAMTSQSIELVNGLQFDADSIRAMGHTLDGPTGRALTRQAFDAAGLIAESEYRIFYRTDAQTIRELLRARWFVVLFIDYGVLQDTAPQIVGDRDYRGAHAVGLSDWWRGAQGRMVHYHDPIADGRTRAGWTAPKGVQAVKFSLVRDAAYGFTRQTGIVSGYAVEPSI